MGRGGTENAQPPPPSPQRPPPPSQKGFGRWGNRYRAPVNRWRDPPLKKKKKHGWGGHVLKWLLPARSSPGANGKWGGGGGGV